MTNQFEKEEMLAGGNISNVYRTGDSVRRELKKDSAKIHKLLKHLESKGFKYAPKLLGIDDKGREILTYIEGEAGNYPLKEYMWSNNVLANIAKMLRRYHDAVSDFPYSDEWVPMVNTPYEAEVICHNDFAIYNIIFKDNKPVGIIDFDVAAPGPRLWDIAYTLYTCVPLSRLKHNPKGEEIHYDTLTDANYIKDRVKLFFESYGMDGENFLEMVLLRLEGLCKYMIKMARDGDVAFQTMIEQGHLEHYQKDITFIQYNGKYWI